MPWRGVVIATATGSWEEGPEGPPRRRKRGVGKLNGPEKQWQPLPVGPQPDLVLSRAGAGQAGRWPAGGLGLRAFVPKVPRRRDHWPFLAWALRATGNSSRTIISGGMCYPPSSQKARLGPIRSDQQCPSLASQNFRGSWGPLGATVVFRAGEAGRPGWGQTDEKSPPRAGRGGSVLRSWALRAQPGVRLGQWGSS